MPFDAQVEKCLIELMSRLIELGGSENNNAAEVLGTFITCNQDKTSVRQYAMVTQFFTKMKLDAARAAREGTTSSSKSPWVASLGVSSLAMRLEDAKLIGLFTADECHAAMSACVLMRHSIAAGMKGGAKSRQYADMILRTCCAGEPDPDEKAERIAEAIRRITDE